MIREDVSEVVEFLNSLLKYDWEAVQELVQTRVKCNKRLADHPTVQVGLNQDDSGVSEYYVGLLGILNGYFGVYDDGPKEGWGAIAAVFDENDLLQKFIVLENEE